MEAVARRDVENGLAQTNRLGRDLDGLVIGDEFEGLFEREDGGRRDPLGVCLLYTSRCV